MPGGTPQTSRAGARRRGVSRFVTPVFALLAGTLLLLACGGESSGSADTVTVRIGDVASFEAELAVTPDERSTGLGGRDQLPEGRGMLFVFREEREASFWMKGMRFPLDFVWISAERAVVDFTENVPPPEPGTPDDQLPLYLPDVPVLYVLEVNAGLIESLGIEAGDTVLFEPELGVDDTY